MHRVVVCVRARARARVPPPFVSFGASLVILLSLSRPLHISAFKCDEEIVALILKYDANPKEIDAGGNDAIKLAAKTGRTKSKELLELHAASSA